MREDTLEYRHYRCRTDTSVGSKDWAIAITPDGHLAVRHGATGKTARLVDIPPSSFQAPSPQAEMSFRERKQIDQGYVFIGRAIVRAGHLEPVTTRPPARGTPNLHWEIKSPIARQSLLEELGAALAQLQTGPLPDVVLFDPTSGVCTVCSQIYWEFGYSDAGGIGADHRGGGVIHAEQGILPILLMIALQRSFPDQIAIADSQGHSCSLTFRADDPLIGAQRFERSLVVDLVSRLGLCSSWIPMPQSANIQAAIWV